MLRPALAIVLLLTLGGTAACGAAAQIDEVEEPTVAMPKDQVTAIRGVVEQYRQAYEVGSVEALESLYGRDLDLVLVYQGRPHRGWTAVHEFLTSRLSGGTQVRMSIKDLSVQPLGPDAVVLSATRTSTMGDGSVSVTESGQLTLTLENREGKWLVVAEHFSYPVGRS